MHGPRIGPPVTRRAPCAAASGARAASGAVARAAGVEMTVAGAAAANAARVSAAGGDDCCWLPPMAKTWSSASVPPLDEVGVPPTVIARYSLPPFRYSVGPAAMGAPVWNLQSTLPVLTSNARRTPSPPPAKPRPLAVVVTPPRSGSGVWNFQTRRPVATLIALIEP